MLLLVSLFAAFILTCFAFSLHISIKLGPGFVWKCCLNSLWTYSFISIMSRCASFISLFIAFIYAVESWLKWFTTFVVVSVRFHISLLSMWTSIFTWLVFYDFILIVTIKSNRITDSAVFDVLKLQPFACISYLISSSFSLVITPKYAPITPTC